MKLLTAYLARLQFAETDEKIYQEINGANEEKLHARLSSTRSVRRERGGSSTRKWSS